MSDLIGIAEAILTTSERRLEVVSSNIANAGTAGYKSEVSFADMMSESGDVNAEKSGGARATDFSQGRLSKTGSPIDFAISGSGLFKVRGGDDVYYTRQSKFQMVEGGRLTTAGGLYLQDAGGGDVVLDNLMAQVQLDGTILEDGLPTGKVGVFVAQSDSELTSLGGTLFRSNVGELDTAQTTMVRQGYVENANVAMADQMTLMMSSIREAETGSKLVQTYDTLMGQAISTFGQSAR